MALAGGSKLGPYEIVGPLGAGGMGEMYPAKIGQRLISPAGCSDYRCLAFAPVS
jgi:hypothetical protein